MPKVDNQASLSVNLNLVNIKSTKTHHISTRKTKVVETIMVMKKKMVKMNAKKIRLMLMPGPRL